jgi:hypothetical protein
MGRVATGEIEGFWSSDPTPEAFAAHQADVDNVDDLVFHPDAISWGAWLGGLAAQRQSPTR